MSFCCTLPVKSPYIKGSDMLKMIDVLEQSLVQNFTHSLNSHTGQFDELFKQGILNTSDSALQNVVVNFFNRADAIEAAKALDISAERIAALQSATALKDDQYVADTAKIVALCLALETDALAQVEVSDCLQDYPM
ncbi:hypothetical protein GCM10023345_14670 [Acinetobacter kookii]|uniref:Uncharacterized protein n=2 Tax=Acinetobacter kookii TaxID=1226327 RepID=A0A1G6GPH3_9GAMM|nr:hypothetical protein SAMN05421732_101188 [Acinetobacter kookii]